MDKKILVVDDERDFLEIAVVFLKGLGYSVITAGDGDSAIKKAVSEVPDIILLDVVMPGKNGFEVCKELKSKKKTKDIDVIVMSGKINEIEQGFDFGATDCVIKPVDWNKLAERLREIREK